MGIPNTSRQGLVAKTWDSIRRYGRWWVASGWHSRRAWRAIVLGVVALAIVLTIVRKPLAEWLWPESRIQQLLDEGNLALAQGRLSAADGSGARERFEAAAALDSDRSDVTAALARTGNAALETARAALGRGDFVAAQRAVVLARELQMPQRDIDLIVVRLHARAHDSAGIDELLQQAQAAQQSGRLDDGDDSALPLYQRVLASQPDRMQALEGREDALSDLLQRARALAARGDVAAAAQQLQRVQIYDPGHVDLPATQAALSEAVEQRRLRADRDLARRRTAAAATGFKQVLQAAPEDALARRGLDAVVVAYAQDATRLASDFKFTEAAAALSRARELNPAAAEVASAQLAITRAQQAQKAMESNLSPTQRERQIRSLLAQMEAAEARGQWLLPPGNSAYDTFKAAQALAPRDPRVRDAARRLLPAANQCLEENLRENRLRAARSCLDAWQALAPADSALPTARRRLAQRWVAVGSERLGAGDADFAQQALVQARDLDGASQEVAAFAERVRSVATPR